MLDSRTNYQAILDSWSTCKAILDYCLPKNFRIAVFVSNITLQQSSKLSHLAYGPSVFITSIRSNTFDASLSDSGSGLGTTG